MVTCYIKRLAYQLAEPTFTKESLINTNHSVEKNIEAEGEIHLELTNKQMRFCMKVRKG